VSGAFFLARREVFEAVGGFDERYFMFAEDMALCWQVRELGFALACLVTRWVTHIEGVSRARAPRAMLIAHHRGALRFECRQREDGVESWRHWPSWCWVLRLCAWFSCSAHDVIMAPITMFPGLRVVVVESRCQSRAKRPT